jgi:isochorismate pyruvate lyase
MTPHNTDVMTTSHSAHPHPQVAHCTTMGEVRQHIDALDDKIVALLSERGGYVAQAARIKLRADQIVDLDRIERIVLRVRQMSLEQGAPEAVAEATYRAMIDAFIAFERGEFERLKAGGTP